MGHMSGDLILFVVGFQNIGSISADSEVLDGVVSVTYQLNKCLIDSRRRFNVTAVAKHDYWSFRNIIFAWTYFAMNDWNVNFFDWIW